MSIQHTPSTLVEQAEGIEQNAERMEASGMLNAGETARAIAARLRAQADTLPVDQLIARSTTLDELERGLALLESGASLDAWASQERQVAPRPMQATVATPRPQSPASLPVSLKAKLDMVPREWGRVEFGVSVSCVSLIRRGLVEKRRHEGHTEYRRID